MIGSYQQYPKEYGNGVNKYSNQWEFKEAENYSSFQSIAEAFPQLKNINSGLNLEEESNATGIIIRSANDDNVHKAIKYGIWTTTPKNKMRLEQLWQRNQMQHSNTYLFFSVVKSGMFEGVARLKSGYHEQSFPFWWQNQTLKFKGYFEIEWVFIKDINYKHFDGFYNMQQEQISKSKDCDIIDSATTVKLLKLFQEKISKRWIFMDFAFMDERQLNYVRKMYQYYSNNSNSSYGGYNVNGYDYHPQQFQQPGMMNHPMSFMPQNNQMHPLLPIPTTMLRPMNVDTRQASNLGFQMNPVSKNKKK